jgi:hypothetical protein
MAFLDVEAALLEVLEPIATVVTNSGDLLGEEDTFEEPLIIVNRVGGGSDSRGVFDIAQVQIDCLAETRAGSYALNQQVRQTLVGAAAVPTSFGLIDYVIEDLAPTEIPYGLESVDIRRASSTWIVSSRAL